VVGLRGIGVVGGRVLLRVLPLATIRKVAGVILVGFAIFTAVQAATG
jgi:putative Ca2+/H+ antiporter (TMEM165/GDT1 family)